MKLTQTQKDVLNKIRTGSELCIFDMPMVNLYATLDGVTINIRTAKCIVEKCRELLHLETITRGFRRKYTYNIVNESEEVQMTNTKTNQELSDKKGNMMEKTLDENRTELMENFNNVNDEGDALYAWEKFGEIGTYAISLTYSDNAFTVVDKDSNIVDDLCFYDLGDALELYNKKQKEANEASQFEDPNPAKGNGEIEMSFLDGGIYIDHNSRMIGAYEWSEEDLSDLITDINEDEITRQGFNNNEISYLIDAEVERRRNLALESA